jgi:citrate synthase
MKLKGQCKLIIDGKELELPVVVGSEGERAIDISELRSKTRYITLDPGYMNTGSCTSNITFISRKLYPNVDFYSGLVYMALGFPVNMFTVLFAIGRMPGWIAHWKEMIKNPNAKIGRPRQIYTGRRERSYVPIEERGAGSSR